MQVSGWVRRARLAMLKFTLPRTNLGRIIIPITVTSTGNYKLENKIEAGTHSRLRKLGKYLFKTYFVDLMGFITWGPFS